MLIAKLFIKFASTHRFFLTVLVVFVVGLIEMNRRSNTTKRVALAWLVEHRYTVNTVLQPLKANVWANPALVVIHATDEHGRAVDLTLTVNWLMGGVPGKGEVKLKTLVISKVL